MNKYHARKTLLDGIWFDSKAEAARYAELKLMARAGEIEHLRLQPRYIIHDAFRAASDGKKYRKIEYVGDFEYWDPKRHRLICEDVKGARTDLYRVKRKLFLARYPSIYHEEID